MELAPTWTPVEPPLTFTKNLLPRYWDQTPLSLSGRHDSTLDCSPGQGLQVRLGRLSVNLCMMPKQVVVHLHGDS